MFRACKAFSLRGKEVMTRLFMSTTESFFGQFSSVLDLLLVVVLCSSWGVGEESFPRGPGPSSIYENKCCEGRCVSMQDIGCGGPQSEMRISS